jgi:hypothetical protein
MDGVGEEYEWPKKQQGWWVVQLLSVSCRIPVGLGNVVIRLYISVACGCDGGNESGTVGLVPKRKWRWIRPRQPKGSIAKGMSVMLLCKMLPMIASPEMAVPVGGSRLLPQLSFRFCRLGDAHWHWPIKCLEHLESQGQS